MKWIILLAAMVAGVLGGCGDATSHQPAAASKPTATQASGDEPFLDDLQQRSLAFFLEQADPSTGLVPDRAPADGGQSAAPASMAATGYGLAALCIADQRGWLQPANAKERTLTALRWLADRQENVHGFFYHFVDKQTGARVWNCELSSIDTALLLGGVLTAKGHFADAEVSRLADVIYGRIDWPWMLNGGDTLSMGWTPEKGFLDARWNGFSEHPILDMLAIGSPTHPIPARCWEAWSREPMERYAGYTYLQCPPLFTHQFSQAFIDFRNQRDAFADHWSNSVYATLAHRQFCIDLAKDLPGYGPDVWGITASDSAKGYVAWGGPPASGPIDGTVVPCAAAGSLPFAPTECMAALHAMQDRFGARVWKRYGFVDAFQPRPGWTDSDVIGIDVGITLLMVENARSGDVWKWFMANPEISQAMRAAGFRQMTTTFSADDQQYLRTLAADTWRCIDSMVEPTTGLPYDNDEHGEFTSVSNIGMYLTDLAVAQKIGMISRQDAVRRLDQALTSIEKLPVHDGFQQSWHSVKTLEPAKHDPWVSVLDSGNLAAGLITAGQAFPELSERCRKLAWAMDYVAFLDPAKNQLWGGRNVVTGEINRQWYNPFLGSDARMAVFLGIAGGKLPLPVWDALDRGKENRYQVDYLVPGWQGGGLFMQYISGLWLDEHDTLAGRSAQSFAYAQMRHADALGAPAWGWSACAGPEGEYLGWGKIQDEVITPHACVLAIGDFGPEAVRNLRELEKLGTRPTNLGFVDSVNWKTKKTSPRYLVLDQSMLLISIANALDGGMVQKWFAADPLVQKGYQTIADYRDRPYARTSVYRLDR